MPHLDPLGLKVLFVMGIYFGSDGDLFDHLDAVTLEAYHLLGIIREEPKLTHAEIEKDLGAKAIIAQIGGEAEPGIGLHCIEPFFLQLVSVDFRGQANAAPFLPHIKEDAVSFLGDLPQRRV
jgi:hypothetical protein